MKIQKIQNKPLTTKEFIIMVVIGIIIWYTPKWFFGIDGIIISGLLPIIGFGIGYLVVMLLRKIKKRKNK